MPGSMQIFRRTAAVLPIRTGAFDDQAAQSVPGSSDHVINLQAQAVTPAEIDSPATVGTADPSSSVPAPSPAAASTASEVCCTSPNCVLCQVMLHFGCNAKLLSPLVVLPALSEVKVVCQLLHAVRCSLYRIQQVSMVWQATVVRYIWLSYPTTCMAVVESAVVILLCYGQCQLCHLLI